MGLSHWNSDGHLLTDVPSGRKKIYRVGIDMYLFEVVSPRAYSLVAPSGIKKCNYRASIDMSVLEIASLGADHKLEGQGLLAHVDFNTSLKHVLPRILMSP